MSDNIVSINSVWVIFWGKRIKAMEHALSWGNSRVQALLGLWTCGTEIKTKTRWSKNQKNPKQTKTKQPKKWTHTSYLIKMSKKINGSKHPRCFYKHCSFPNTNPAAVLIFLVNSALCSMPSIYAWFQLQSTVWLTLNASQARETVQKIHYFNKPA